MRPVRLRGVRVLDDRVDLMLEADPAPMTGDDAERAGERLLEWLPGLARHHCSTGDDRSFSEEMRHTEAPHLFEHVVLEVLVRAGSAGRMRGETVWRKGDGAYRVSIYDDDDAVCLGAVRLALRIMGAAFGGTPPVDIDAEVARLGAMRDAEPSPA